jgi:hypothetical protein
MSVLLKQPPLFNFLSDIYDALAIAVDNCEAVQLPYWQFRLMSA